MKFFILGISGLMLLGLIIMGFLHEETSQDSTSRQWERSNEVNLQEQSDREPPPAEELQPVNPDDEIGYSLQNDELNLTFNHGIDWVKVPVDKDQLFEGEYNGNKQQLIDDSFVLTEERVAFLYSEGPSWEDKSILLTYSLDQGQTWENTVVTEPFPAMRFRKVEFLNNTFGYVIISGGRTMSQEYSAVHLTHDGGRTWEETNNSDVTRLIYDGGFVDESTGFLSFGTINPEEPDVYVTQDGGGAWEKASFKMPGKYDRIFVSAEVPVKEEEHLAVLVNQGPNGDYLGGRVKGKFISNDNGMTWEFLTEVQPDEPEQQG
ncbi:WD40/YVTN/BNR-like repeat-containing protein [Sediminibacillus massiliensis]|uniref:WD40/YVTN/BNR-like repeat-containing protein n=1 Tax=Sediminibacillus massiliensis TaxID=1926277 RepID=UPI00098881A7|nr:sialidase family protein [Sediminibacillus massiliensis]